MRCLAAALALLLLASSGCGVSSGTTPAPKPPSPGARLILATIKPDRAGALLQPIDPDTLTDDTRFEPLDLPRCSSGLSVAPPGAMAVAVAGAVSWSRDCGDAASATLKLVDLNAWTWRDSVQLPSDVTLRLDVTDRWPLAWSADGQAVYALTTTPSEERQLWRIDLSAPNQPVKTAIDYVPQRIDIAPNGAAIFVLGGQSGGNSRQGPSVAGSAFVAIYDPLTLAERIRVPLSGLSLGLPQSPPGSLIPGVAVAPDGSRYFVAHADRPVLDVVDTRAPKLERLERSLSLRGAALEVGTRTAWLGISPDGSRLFAWRHAEVPADDLGLQMIDLRSWQVTTIDPIASRIGFTRDGRWAFELDPPMWARPGAARSDQRGPRNPTGARLSVLAGGREVALLAHDDGPFAVSQYGADRLYVMSSRSLVAFDTQTWHEIARRQTDWRAALVGTRTVW